VVVCLTCSICSSSDKRVLHDKITILEERMNYIVERYGTSPEYKKKLHNIWDISIALERKIFDNISFHPDLLVHQLTPVDASSEIEKYKTWVLSKNFD
jgi:hypothetical protein